MSYVIGIVLLAQLVPVVAFLAHLAFGKPHSRLEWLMLVATYGAFFVYSFLGYAWDWFGYYFRYILLAAFAGLSIVAWKRTLRTRWRPEAGWKHWVTPAVSALAFVLFSWLAVLAVGGQFFRGDPLHLAFPLRDGTYYVGQGGSHSLVNYHVASKSQRFAVDVVALNSLGFHANGVIPKELSGYIIYGKPVHSPCNGVIETATNNLPESLPPAADRRNPPGNHVVLRCDGVNVVMAHLQPGSVIVKVGQRVRTGDMLGRVGNSGNSSEPHLHIHAEKGGPDNGLGGEGIPILFDDRFLTRNSLVWR